MIYVFFGSSRISQCSVYNGCGALDVFLSVPFRCVSRVINAVVIPFTPKGEVLSFLVGSYGFVNAKRPVSWISKRSTTDESVDMSIK